MKNYYPSNNEHGLQVSFFNWVRQNRKNSTNKGIRNALNLCYAVPNGLSTNQSQRAKMEGLTAGIPDINLDWPVFKKNSNCPEVCGYKYKHPGLRIEMKYGKNTLSPFQKEKKKLLQDACFRYEVCYSAQTAIDAVMDYLPFPSEDYIKPEYV